MKSSLLFFNLTSFHPKVILDEFVVAGMLNSITCIVAALYVVSSSVPCIHSCVQL